jgi:NAD(P) transhydrogenase subunit alpha
MQDSAFLSVDLATVLLPVVATAAPVLGVPPYVLIFGVTLAASPLMSSPGDLRFLDEMTAVREQSRALRDAGARVLDSPPLGRAEALPSSVPNHASALYARNVAALIEHLLDEKGFHLDPADPILDDCLITHDGICRREDILFPSRPEPVAAAG